MTQPSLTTKFLSGEAYYRFSSIMTKVLGLATTFYVLHALTLYQYGVLQLLFSIFGAGIVLFYLAGNVIGNDIQRFIAGGQEGHAKKMFIEYNLIRLSIGLALTLAMIFGAPLLSHWYKADFIQMLQILGLYFFVEAASGSLLSLVKVRLNFKAAALEPTYGKLGQLAMIIIFSLTIGITTREALLAGLVGNIVAACSMIPAARASWRQWAHIPRYEAGVLWEVLRVYGKWDAVRQIISNLVSNVQPWLIKIFISTEAVAVYSVTLTLVDVAKSLLGFETLTSLVPRQLADLNASRRTFLLGLKYLFLLALMVTFGALIVAPSALSVFFPKYLPSLPYFFALIWVVPLVVFTMQMETFLVALREQKFLFTISLSRNIVTPILLIVTLPILGLWGAVIAKLVITISLIVAERTYVFKKYAHLRFTFRELFRWSVEDRAFFGGLWRQARTLLSVKIASVLR